MEPVIDELFLYLRKPVNMKDKNARIAYAATVAHETEHVMDVCTDTTCRGLKGKVSTQKELDATVAAGISIFNSGYGSAIGATGQYVLLYGVDGNNKPYFTQKERDVVTGNISKYGASLSTKDIKIKESKRKSYALASMKTIAEQRDLSFNQDARYLKDGTDSVTDEALGTYFKTMGNNSPSKDDKAKARKQIKAFAAAQCDFEYKGYTAGSKVTKVPLGANSKTYTIDDIQADGYKDWKSAFSG